MVWFHHVKHYRFRSRSRSRSLSKFSMVPAAAAAAVLHQLSGEVSCEAIGQFVFLSSPEEVGGLRWLAVLCVDEKGTELDGQGGPDQAHAAAALRAGVIHSPAGRVHVDFLWAEGNRQLVGPAAVRQQLPRRFLLVLQQVSEDHGTVVATKEVPLPATERQEGKGLLVAASLIQLQPTEEEDQELLVFKAGHEVLYLGVVQKELSLVVNIVEVLSDPRFRALALGVRGGPPGGGAAGREAALRGHQSPAAEAHTPDHKHGESPSMEGG